MQVYKKPTYTEADNNTEVNITPNMARIRNLTYESNLYLNMTIEPYKIINDEEILIEKEVEEFKQIKIGKIPIMVRSKFCYLADKTDKEIIEEGECEYDEGGYFIIKGNEKVIVA